MSSTVTVACGAGFAGDRMEPAVDFATAEGIDAIVLECLAERTMIAGLLEREKNPSLGYDARLRPRLSPILPLTFPRRRAVITNLGSANPSAAAAEVARLAGEMGLAGLRVAAVLGDDIVDRESHVEWQDDSVLEDGGRWLGVHAYLGVDPIAEAIRQGADVVITGRTTDSSLFAAPVVAAFGEGALAGALTVGHLLECSGQLTGGNVADSRESGLTAAEYADLGFPWARVSADGSAEFGVLDGKPARLDPLGATLQLFYEVHDPHAYLTPDAILDFTGIAFDPLAPNRIRMSGARSSGIPERLKAVGFRQAPGCIADLEISYAGHGCRERVLIAAETMRIRLEAIPGVSRFNLDFVGINSVLGLGVDIPWEGSEVRLHVGAVCDSDATARSVEDEIYALTLSGPAGGCGIRSERRAHLSVESGLIARDQVTTSLGWYTA
ncbi:unannotated protein [freshwater metagenome]|uniref:Unannotated protein n=1 Tax=freshwater metagenome TaxID=449393 RepID=A0A6J7C2I4_9ZZZZ|nr:acyclic terpene utilization AtuA family protein [Actinomycetota bacterium]